MLKTSLLAPTLARTGLGEIRRETRYLLIGDPIPHRESLVEMLGERPELVSWLPDSITYRREHGQPRPGKLTRVFDQMFGTRHPEYLKQVVQEIDRTGTEVVIGYWGTLTLADLKAIKKERPQLKFVTMVLCHPLALAPRGIARQNFLMRQAAKFHDGFIFPSEEMKTYFLTHVFKQGVFKRQVPPCIVIPPCWPEAFQSTNSQQPQRVAPNLIFTGRTDLSGETVHPADDIRGLMNRLLDAGIELHHVYSPETNDGHPQRRLFQPLSQPDLIEFMSGFDASLVTYNTDVCQCVDRFQFTIADRLLTSVAAGIPIAIPRQGFAASKSYLKNYPAVIEFDSPQELAESLADRSRIAALREAAWQSRSHYAAKLHAAKLQQFMEEKDEG